MIGLLKNYDINVLVVDDSATQLSLALGFLNSMHIKAQISSDGQKALKIIENSETPFDLILTDYNMPNMNGMDLNNKS